MQKKFTPMGKIQKHHDATAGAGGRVETRRTCDRRRDVPKLLNGREVDVNFVQERPGHEVLHRLRRHRPDLPVRQGGERPIESRLMTAPLKAVQKVITGQQIAARLSAPAPIIDADEEQRRPIDEGLIRSFA